MIISRVTSTRIMSKAIQAPQSCLLGLLEPCESVSYFDSPADLEQAIQSQASAVIVYNQHPDAIQFMEDHPLSEGQFSIEIFQDIEGVFGLRAYTMEDRMLRPVEITFHDSKE